MTKQLEALLTARTIDPSQWRWTPPEIIDAKVSGGETRLAELLGNEHLPISDPIDRIAEDLAKLRYPNAKDAEARERDRRETLANRVAYGQWALFCSNRLGSDEVVPDGLVHYPEPEDHYRIRTLRNEPLVTREEHDGRFRHLNIGLFGLSVGSQIALRLARSGIGDTYVLADADSLDHSNTNRMDFSLQDVGKHKVDLLCRELSKIDPFLTLIPLRQGFDGTEATLQTIRESGLDTMFDEVDDMRAKLQIWNVAAEIKAHLLSVADIGRTSLLMAQRPGDVDAVPFNGRLSAEDVARLREGPLSPSENLVILERLIHDQVGERLGLAIQECLQGKRMGAPQLGATAAQGSVVATWAMHAEAFLEDGLSPGDYAISPAGLLGLTE
jgi:hypothetical protein